MTDDAIAAELRANRKAADERHNEYVEQLRDFGLALAEVKAATVSTHQALDAHVEFCDWRYGRVDSDVKGLRKKVETVDNTSRQLEVDAAAAQVRVGQAATELAQTDGRRHDWTRSLTIVVLGLLCTVLGAVAKTFL
jgi:uncharacterized membrane protein YdfJ with MMPL/SSD domain